MSQGGSRRKVYGFKAERQAFFSKNVRQTFLEEGRRKKDEERARMEAYRKLCKEEGILSKRLEDYDRTRKSATEELSSILEQVDYDQSLTNNEKKKRKYNLKRKFSATTVNDLIDKKQKHYNAVSGMEEVQRKRQKEREEKQQARLEREQEKRACVQARKSRNTLFAKRTKKGQPVMSSRIESLLQKIGKQ
ncbi:putative rRNA processing [Leishmania naiffi]|uniref:rRNA processing n=1 Tax=Leishmania naiffi TaxID=5678 RepID=A0AAW3BE56_9TRYP